MVVTYSIVLLCVLLFFTSRYVLTLAEIIGLESCLGIFAAVAFMGLAFTIFLLPETKGINLNTNK